MAAASVWATGHIAVHALHSFTDTAQKCILSHAQQLPSLTESVCAEDVTDGEAMCVVKRCCKHISAYAGERGCIWCRCRTCWDSSEVGIVVREDALSKLQQVGWQGDCIAWVPSGVEEDASSLLCCKLHTQGP